MTRPDTRARRLRVWLERTLWVIGAASLSWVAATALDRQATQRAAQARLESVIAATAAAPTPPPRAPVPGELVGRIEIPRLGVSALVITGDDARTLRRAVGHLPDTPLPWQSGNSALAGHRDTFFRPLQRVRPGDEVRLTTPHGTLQYRVQRRLVVEPDALWVLDRAPETDLTLITCYPFDAVGPAPRRFIVQASRVPGAGGVSPGQHRL